MINTEFEVILNRVLVESERTAKACNHSPEWRHAFDALDRECRVLRMLWLSQRAEVEALRGALKELVTAATRYGSVNMQRRQVEDAIGRAEAAIRGGK